MARKVELKPSARWYRIEVDDSDWGRHSQSDHTRWYGQMLLVRRFEESILELADAGLVHGPAHASIGQEATAVGSLAHLGVQDQINGTHRAHHQVLIKLMNAHTPKDFDVRIQEFTPEMDEAVRRLMAEIMGLTPGYCGGRGGSMHMRDAASGITGTSAIVGGNVPHAVGYALADTILGRDGISVAFFGDGAALQGAVYESINIAAARKLPVVFFIENNLYGVSTHIKDVTGETRLASRGPMLGCRGIECDGMDVVAVYEAVHQGIAAIREGQGPVVVEAMCYRFLDQSGSRKGSDKGYRSAREEGEWRQRDPILLAEHRLRESGLLDVVTIAQIDRRVTGAVKRAVERLTERTPGRTVLRIPDKLWPDPASADFGILSDGSELEGAKFRELEDYAPEVLAKSKFVHAAAEALGCAMEADPSIVVMGEDVQSFRGGVSGFTRVALEKFPERVLAMPIAENGFTGVALGAALRGLRPVVEIMFSDFSLMAADQIGNGIGKVRHMFGGTTAVPIVMRVRVSPRNGYGSQHSGDLSALFHLFPGWHIFAPSTPFDYVGMLNTALRSDDPVMIVEQTELYQQDGLVPRDERDFCIPFAKGKVVRPGSVCTVLATSVMVPLALKVAQEAGIDAEIIDMRSLGQMSTDWPLVLESVGKTNRVLIAEQTASGLALGRHWVAEIQSRAFDDLDHEIVHVTGGMAAPVVSAALNPVALATAEQLRQALVTLVKA